MAFWSAAGNRESTPSKALSPLLYLVYGLLATALFAYLLFPRERLKAFIVAHATALVPQLSLMVEDVGIGFPVNVELEGVTWLLEGTPVMTSERVRIRPHVMSLIQKKKPLRLVLTIGSAARCHSAALGKIGTWRYLRACPA